jgi:hypothetical protein
MGRILRTNRATEDLVEIFTEAARRSPQLLARRRAAFEKTAHQRERSMNLQRSSANRPASYQDVLDAPPNMVAEIIRGALHLQPRPAMPHAGRLHAGRRRSEAPSIAGVDGPGGW